MVQVDCLKNVLGWTVTIATNRCRPGQPGRCVSIVIKQTHCETWGCQAHEHIHVQYMKSLYRLLSGYWSGRKYMYDMMGTGLGQGQF